jgi:hypothetical protein
LVRFSDLLLRSVLDDMSAQEVPLRREAEYLRLYLAIEEVRFQDRLQMQVLIDPSPDEDEPANERERTSSLLSTHPAAASSSPFMASVRLAVQTKPLVAGMSLDVKLDNSSPSRMCWIAVGNTRGPAGSSNSFGLW